MSDTIISVKTPLFYVGLVFIALGIGIFIYKYPHYYSSPATKEMLYGTVEYHITSKTLSIRLYNSFDKPKFIDRIIVVTPLSNKTIPQKLIVDPEIRPHKVKVLDFVLELDGKPEKIVIILDDGYTAVLDVYVTS